MISKKLEVGDHIRVIAPSMSLALIDKQNLRIAEERIKSLGLSVSYGAHVREKDELISSRVESRVSDLNDAFKDKSVDAILTVIGGFNSNQLLKHLDYKAIRSNPKIFCGYSDITVLSNAIFAKTGLVTYSGPHFSSFGMKKGFEYTMEGFKNCLFSSRPFEITPSKEWSNDKWYLDQNKRKFVKNKGPIVINKGEAKGRIIGGNLGTLSLLQGTEFMPSLKDSILFIEDDYESRAVTFDRVLQSLLHQPGFERVRGIVIGRFERESNISDRALRKIIQTKKELMDIPIVANVDFGHTTPMITFPIGGEGKINLNKNNMQIEVKKH